MLAGRFMVAVPALVLASTQQVEKITPPGAVPPAQGTAAESSRPTDTSDIEPLRRPVPPDDSPEVLASFTEEYRLHKQPRMAIYFNRELSDEVREWASESRLAVSVRRKDRAQATEESTWIAEQTYLYPDGRKPAPTEMWMWGFEDRFLETFLSAHAHLVDRATILRLTAARSHNPVDLGSAPVKKIEMDALATYADLFMEILVLRSPDAPTGYEYRASAKDVRDGRLLASVTSLRWPSDTRTRTQTFVSESGYHLAQVMPPVGEVSRRLALDLMQALSQYWSAFPVENPASKPEKAGKKSPRSGK